MSVTSGTGKAKEIYREFLNKYPGSVYAQKPAKDSGCYAETLTKNLLSIDDSIRRG